MHHFCNVGIFLYTVLMPRSIDRETRCLKQLGQRIGGQMHKFKNVFLSYLEGDGAANNTDFYEYTIIVLKLFRRGRGGKRLSAKKSPWTRFFFEPTTPAVLRVFLSPGAEKPFGLQSWPGISAAGRRSAAARPLSAVLKGRGNGEPRVLLSRVLIAAAAVREASPPALALPPSTTRSPSRQPVGDAKQAA